MTGVTFAVAWGLATVAPGVWWLQLIVWLVAGAHPVTLFYHAARWQSDQVLVTDRARFVRVSGVFTTSIDERDLARVTDLGMHQSLSGRLFGYGTFRFESAGRHDDGAKRELVEWVPNPALVYQAIHDSRRWIRP